MNIKRIEEANKDLIKLQSSLIEDNDNWGDRYYTGEKNIKIARNFANKYNDLFTIKTKNKNRYWEIEYKKDVWGVDTIVICWCREYNNGNILNSFFAKQEKRKLELDLANKYKSLFSGNKFDKRIELIFIKIEESWKEYHIYFKVKFNGVTTQEISFKHNGGFTPFQNLSEALNKKFNVDEYDKWNSQERKLESENEDIKNYEERIAKAKENIKLINENFTVARSVYDIIKLSKEETNQA